MIYNVYTRMVGTPSGNKENGLVSLPGIASGVYFITSLAITVNFTLCFVYCIVQRDAVAHCEICYVHYISGPPAYAGCGVCFLRFCLGPSESPSQRARLDPNLPTYRTVMYRGSSPRAGIMPMVQP